MYNGIRDKTFRDIVATKRISDKLAFQSFSKWVVLDRAVSNNYSNLRQLELIGLIAMFPFALHPKNYPFSHQTPSSTPLSIWLSHRTNVASKNCKYPINSTQRERGMFDKSSFVSFTYTPNWVWTALVESLQCVLHRLHLFLGLLIQMSWLCCPNHTKIVGYDLVSWVLFGIQSVNATIHCHCYSMNAIYFTVIVIEWVISWCKEINNLRW